MHRTKSTAPYSTTCRSIGTPPSGWKSSQTNTPAAGATAAAKTRRSYHRGRSKQMMNVSRYSASGNTQRNGTAATSCVSVFVVPSSRTDAHAGSASQSTRAGHDGARGAAGSEGTDVAGEGTSFARRLAWTTAHSAHSAAKLASPTDHATACCLRVSAGSIRNG
jgi:hypothetical protein